MNTVLVIADFPARRIVDGSFATVEGARAALREWFDPDRPGAYGVASIPAEWFATRVPLELACGAPPPTASVERTRQIA